MKENIDALNSNIVAGRHQKLPITIKTLTIPVHFSAVAALMQNSN